MRKNFSTTHKNLIFTATAALAVAAIGLTVNISEAPASAEVLSGASVPTVAPTPIESGVPEVPTAPAAPPTPAAPVAPVVPVVPTIPVVPVVPTVPTVPVSPPTPTSPSTPPATPGVGPAGATTPVVPPVSSSPAGSTASRPVAARVAPVPQRTSVQRPASMQRLSSGFGPRRAPCRGCSRFHEGLDITPGRGKPVVAIADGVVVQAGSSRTMGVYTAISHVINGVPVVSVYEHFQRGSLRYRVGQWVGRGQQIGKVGSTGSSTGAHLHFEIRTAGGQAIDPLAWLNQNVNS